MPVIRKMPPPRWQAPTHRQMWNRKRIPRGKYGAGAVLLWRALSRLRRQLPATFSNGSLECALDKRPHRLHRRRPVENSAQTQDEPPVRIATAARIGSSADDRSTPPFL